MGSASLSNRLSQHFPRHMPLLFLSAIIGASLAAPRSLLFAQRPQSASDVLDRAIAASDFVLTPNETRLVTEAMDHLPANVQQQLVDAFEEKAETRGMGHDAMVAGLQPVVAVQNYQPAVQPRNNFEYGVCAKLIGLPWPYGFIYRVMFISAPHLVDALKCSPPPVASTIGGTSSPGSTGDSCISKPASEMPPRKYCIKGNGATPCGATCAGQAKIDPCNAYWLTEDDPHLWGRPGCWCQSIGCWFYEVQ